MTKEDDKRLRMLYPDLYQTEIDRSNLCRGIKWALILELIICFVLFLVFVCPKIAKAEDYSPETLANSIFKAENSTKYPYGIKSIDTKGNAAYARKICLNTIKNHKKRHLNHECGLDFITCLGNRYCPPTAHKLNQNWVKNVKYWLKRG